MKKEKAFSRLVEISLAGGEYAPASGASRLAAACQLFCLPSTKCPRDVPSEVSNKTNLPLPLPPAPVIIYVIVRACPSHSGTKLLQKARDGRGLCSMMKGYDFSNGTDEIITAL